jgi:hypothetical protein
VTGWLLPSAEAAVAVAILPHWSARWATGVAVALLVAFTGVIIRQPTKGLAPSRARFGVASSAPISRWTVVRNAVIMVVAGVVVGVPGANLPVDHLAGLAVAGASGGHGDVRGHRQRHGRGEPDLGD